MKFAKELEQDAVPEWRAKYLDYKAGKKHVKQITRAVNRANATPRSLPRLTPRDIVRNSPFFSNYGNNGKSPLSRGYSGAGDNSDEAFQNAPAPLGSNSHPESGGSADSGSSEDQITTPMLVPKRKKSPQDINGSMEYGSFVPTPPSTTKPADLLLPGPALGSGSGMKARLSREAPERSDLSADIDDGSLRLPQSAYEVGRTTPVQKSPFRKLRTQSMQIPQKVKSANTDTPSPLLRRLMSFSSPLSSNDRAANDVNLELFDQVKRREKEFFKWMDKELNKIETFYKSKEDEADVRLTQLREQLHEMRNRRIDEIAAAKRAHDIRKDNEHLALSSFRFDGGKPNAEDLPKVTNQVHAWIAPIEKALDNVKAKTLGPHPGKNSKALQSMHVSPNIRPGSSANPEQSRDPGRDYVRRPHYDNEVPYRSAKRKLKIALKEFYRGLELLKSYALLNRTAFRKINKKYDKAVDAHPPLRYMTEKVNKAWFVQSNVLDGHIHAVEDLYARYFERGNHKIAVGKLRSGSGKPGFHDANTFRSGLFIGIGAVFGVQGLIFAADLLLRNPDPTIRLQTSYLLQIYAGYFLALFLFSVFCINCSIWARNKINYVFIFEFDPRNHLDWRQLSEFPAFLTLVLGLFVWINFSQYGAADMFLYYPVVLIFVTAVVIFLPAPILFHKSRRWFAYSHWRLLLAGLYPVEFRDFFLGDMYCSLTYLTSNIELFFCLYAQNWSDPPQCNSTHSRLLGFFSALPAIWRALQCIRRYHDTKVIFPHLVNCGKYGMTIMYYITLSLYRIQESTSLLALFITFATLNSIYTSIWDLAMDWSLCQPQAKKRFLRDVLAYKRAWYYYLAMVLDVILRFNWVFYAIYTHDTQHSSIASFGISFAEVCRRGMWTLFRVENEHCANVSRFKASRDVPLPYALHESSESLNRTSDEVEEANQENPALPASPALSRHRSRLNAAEAGQSSPSNTLRRRTTSSNFAAPPRTLTRIFADAHTQDFEKKRKPGAGDSDNFRNAKRDSSDEEGGKVNSSDDDDDQDEMEVLESASILARHPRRED